MKNNNLINPDDYATQTSNSEDETKHEQHQGIKQTNINLPEYVVGIGASAGGLEALEELFQAMPLKTGMAFVIIQHLSPDYKSLMDELLARKTCIPIQIAENQMAVEADNIYLLPPKKEMIISNGKLLLTEREHSETVNMPINTFFRSLAESYQDKSIAIILSGSGSDGSKGIKLIHDSGGFVITQNLNCCKFDSMPLNANNTNCVDLSLAPNDIPDALIKYSQRTIKATQQIALGSLEANEGRFTDVIVLLNNRFDLDFSEYKPSTIVRRLERRLAMLQAETLKDYTNILLSNEEELEALYFDLLIGVTQFFRDPEAFQNLAKKIPDLLETLKAESNEEVRIWVPGCATGQEAYSLAMLMYDIFHQKNQVRSFKIFATDIHRNSIAIAAQASYTTSEVTGLSSYYKNRYLKKLPNGDYQVIPAIRKRIVFAQHNLLKDPPFTKMHMISCRNLMIYFNQVAQQRIFSLFTFALKNKGLLFLGSSESLGRHASDYQCIDSTYKIFQKNRDTQEHPDFNLGVLDSGQYKLKESKREHHPISIKSKQAQEVLLQQYVPPSILIDCNGNILHVFGNVGEMLKLDVGSASLNLRSMVSGPAKAVCIQMLNQANKTYKPICTRFVEGFAKYDKVDIEIRPLSNSSKDLDYFIVTLKQSNTVLAQQATAGTEAEEVNSNSSIAIRMRELEEELQYTKESLQTTVEELEASNEELQASNEELMASNEELQSTNEELQSVNEELFTVNAEHQVKELERAEIEADEQSIIQVSGIGILFLDEYLHIRKFSESAAKLFSLNNADYGRPLGAISGEIVQSLLTDISQVLNQGGVIEKEFSPEEGVVYQIRIHRLEQLDKTNQQRGVILTFLNISKLYSTQRNLARSESRFQAVLDALTDGYFEWDTVQDKLFLSHYCRQKLGYSNEDTITWYNLLREDTNDVLNTLTEAYEQQKALEILLPLRKQDNNIHWMLCKCRFLAKQQTNQDYGRLAGQFIDMQQYKQLEVSMQHQLHELSRSNELLEQFAHIVSHDLKAPLRHSMHNLHYLNTAIAENDQPLIKKEVNSLSYNLHALQNLIDDVIRFSRFNSEKKKVATVDLNIVVDQAINILAPKITNKNFDLQCEQLPSITGDKSMLSHLFQNLLGNALKYNDKEKPEIIIKYRLEGKYCFIQVQDNGIGFDPNLSENIFKPFKRLVTKSQYEGSGIGLSICKTVVEQHDGKISVDSTPGKGTTFTIQLPLNSQ
ncbi:PAS domain-containing protein [Endozoicomonas sp. SM1973]|uniref:histidine kinase n=1 Tax=Spartinivicinus marinus TaxID=2994442 RepID=A0A853I4V7_9GAMM|nr:CheR family methyltransferase [Spartinivicinus marinus]MCX4025745.1 ATP-binding protein [Spartinivicinus marinus]NYZ65738.1 PAS domain-containing protein [Spartinivicinus marinus]